MSAGLYQVRRATIDDLPNLLPLWIAMDFPAAELERRLTEFQIIETDDGALMGALALEISGRHGRLHSEAFTNFALAESLREQLWARMQSVVENLGLARIWTSEVAPFWKRNGLLPAPADTLKNLPAAWQSLECDWLTLQLRDEAALQATLERGFDKFAEEERQRREIILQKARTWKQIGLGLVTIVVIAAISFCFYLIMHRNQIVRHR